MRRVIGMDLHRTFAEVVFWEDGRLRWHGRVDMTRSGLEGFGRSLGKYDEVVVEATGNAMAVVRVLRPYVARVIVANPLQVKAIAHARIKTDKIDAGVLASLHAARSGAREGHRIRKKSGDLAAPAPGGRLTGISAADRDPERCGGPRCPA
jgi:Transposase